MLQPRWTDNTLTHCNIASGKSIHLYGDEKRELRRLLQGG